MHKQKKVKKPNVKVLNPSKIKTSPKQQKILSQGYKVVG